MSKSVFLPYHIYGKILNCLIFYNFVEKYASIFFLICFYIVIKVILEAICVCYQFLWAKRCSECLFPMEIVLSFLIKNAIRFLSKV